MWVGVDDGLYVLKDGHKFHIHSLAELKKKYRGQPIIDVTAEVLALY